MTVNLRVVTQWTGFSGATGYTNLYWRPGTGGGSVADASDCAARVRAFFATLATNLPASVTLFTSGACEAIEDTTGALTGIFTGTTPSPVTGGGGASFAARGSAWLLQSKTNLVVGRRFLQGRTYLAPLNAASFSTVAGQPTGTATAQAGANAMLTGGSTLSFPVIWSRPSTTPPHVGTSGPVTAYTISLTAAVLRSRRD